MTSHHHSMTDLFAQLGLPCEPGQIQAFIAQHRPLADDVRLADAPFWTPAQAAFIREQRQLDADWSQQIDALSVSLREKPQVQDLAA